MTGQIHCGGLSGGYHALLAGSHAFYVLCIVIFNIGSGHHFKVLYVTSPEMEPGEGAYVVDSSCTGISMSIYSIR